MTIERKHGWSGLCLLNDVLCWERYGYDSECGGPPTYASDLLTDAKYFATIVKPADCRYSVEITEHGNFGTYNGGRPMGVKGKFRVWDEANPWVEAWEVGFLHYDEASARKHYGEKEFANHRRLHIGVIDALLHYAETGEPTLEAWRPGTPYWKHHTYDARKRVFLVEGQPGVILYEKFDNPAYEHLPGMIHVTVQARKVSDWCAECFAETPDRQRRQISAYLHGKTYDEAKQLAEAWISEVGRPHIASAWPKEAAD